MPFFRGKNWRAIQGELNRLADEADWSAFAAKLDEVDPQHLDDAEAVDWYEARGLAAERLGDRAGARAVYEQGLKKHPDSSLMHVNVGRLHEEEGRFEEALPHFAAARVHEGGGRPVMTAARYCYLWDAYEESAALLDQIFTAYFHLGIADDHFLYVRGLPFFSRAFGARAAVAFLTDDAPAAEDLLERCEHHLSDLQIEQSRLVLAAWRGDAGGLVSSLAGDLGGEGQEAFWGATGIQLAVWQSRADEDPERALARLEAVALRDDDFPWLEDVRVLARGRAQRRAGAEHEAGMSVERFLEHQPVLLEPELAFDFGLLDEQEHVKVRYREIRRSGKPPAWLDRRTSGDGD